MTSHRFGRLFYVIGASGSGKDSLMRYARKHVAAAQRIIFTHRYITRLPEIHGENHVYLSEEEFRYRENHGFFSLCWKSHGFFYGIGSEINYWMANGYDVVLNGSRAYLPAALRLYPDMIAILVTTSESVLRKRLFERNRESPEEIEKRLQRARMLSDLKHPRLITLDNDVDLMQSGMTFLKILTHSNENAMERPFMDLAAEPDLKTDLPLQVRFLGTGNAPGVPVRGCECEACAKAALNTFFKRDPCTALIEFGRNKVLIDAGLPDLKQRFPDDTLTAILLTHFHPDHVQGLFAFRWGGCERVEIFAPADPLGCGDLFKNPGILDFRFIEPYQVFEIAGVKIFPVLLAHSRPTLGYCFEHESGRLAYLTDTAGLPDKTEKFLLDWRPDVVVLDCTYPPLDGLRKNHNDITVVLEIFSNLMPQKMLLTHIGHELDCWLSQHQHELPSGVKIARDNTGVSLHEIDV